ncbi:cell division septal protein FtsQ [Breznakia blatticola]|uniref:Cell division septal protein FtsQ n=1 Tax=Breznakia blatticola TaxID=1754012 RepID=A0A4R7Z864_9FIRM|nr:FtsQ-type POTRA domain-containing protein [Breznakia blatticola]TDW08372.1 cell division septal protein FtsQ [Breznakia blatticola]
MARKRHLEDLDDTIDLDGVLRKDEQEIRRDNVLKNRRKRKLRRKRLKRFSIVILIVVIIGYMVSDFSNIRVMKVNNNVIYTQQEILKKANLSYDSKMIMHPGMWIEHKLKEDEFIDDVSVSKNYLTGAIYIDVTEAKVIGHYEEDGKSYVLLANGKSVEMKDNQLALISSPYIKDLNKTQRADLANMLAQIDAENLALISEIRYYKTSYDDNMLELVMSDGHIVRSSYDGLALLKNYRKILEGLNDKLRCINIQESSNSVFTSNCD